MKDSCNFPKSCFAFLKDVFTLLFVIFSTGIIGRGVGGSTKQPSQYILHLSLPDEDVLHWLPLLKYLKEMLMNRPFWRSLIHRVTICWKQLASL